MPAAEPVLVTAPDDPACRITRASVMSTMAAEAHARPIPARTIDGSGCQVPRSARARPAA
ncbi:hypothetical protein AB0M95_24475 [Sphaerisporangium sp. NPDC051017]|uniref:hypothetical protein n=1 Tax=Sphaerisporangium sp. NPDC051017 TaxID=3154636 RepID=UPI00342AA3FF